MDIKKGYLDPYNDQILNLKRHCNKFQVLNLYYSTSFLRSISFESKMGWVRFSTPENGVSYSVININDFTTLKNDSSNVLSLLSIRSEKGII